MTECAPDEAMDVDECVKTDATPTTNTEEAATTSNGHVDDAAGAVTDTADADVNDAADNAADEVDAPPPATLSMDELAASAPLTIVGCMPELEQIGQPVIGPGAAREKALLGVDLPPLRAWQKDIVERAKAYAMDQSVQNILLKQTANHQHNQQKVAMYAQALSLMARIYVGNLPYDMREEEIRNMFSPYGPVKSVHMTIDNSTGNHKGFAFIEVRAIVLRTRALQFEVPEAAAVAIEQMNGICASAKTNIKVGKTLNIPQAQPIIEQVFAEGLQHHRVYASSIHPDLSEKDLKTVFSAFGEVLDCTLAKMTASGKTHRGYGYITYTNDASVCEAVTSMNMFDLGGQFLRVGKGLTPPWAQVYGVPTEATNLPTASALAAASITAKICALEQGIGARGSSPTTQSNAGASVIGASAPRIMIGDVRSSEQDIQQASTVSHSEGTAVYAVPPPGVVLPTLSDTPNVPVADHVKPKEESSATNGVEYGTAQTGAYGIPLTAQPPEQVGALDPDTGAVLPPVYRKPNVKVDEAAMEKANVVDDALKDKETWESQTTSGKERPKSKHSKKSKRDKKDVEEAKTHLAEAKEELEKKNKETAASLAQQEKLEIKGNEQRNMLMHKLMRKTDSAVVLLRDMVTVLDIDEFLEDEVSEECSKYGAVDSVVVVQDRFGPEPEAVHVKIFVKFASSTSATAAQKALDQRFFAGKTITAELYDDNLFNHGEYFG